MITTIETTKLCIYGCGQIAKFKLKNGKLCCSSHYSKCLINRKKNSNNHKLTSIITTELCSFGCEQIAKFKLKNGKLCCSKSWQSCPINSKKLSIGKKLIPIKTTELCSFGCGQQAKFKFKNGKLCCNKYVNKCSINSKKLSIGKKLIPIKTTELCSFGCGQQAKFKFKNGKLCCSNHLIKCPINNKKMRNNHKLIINKIKEKYPIFYKTEDLRYNPKNPNEKEIQVRCKYNKCKNSKKNNGWFTPTRGQLHQRIEAIEKPKGYGESNFYCSDECKEKCDLFGLRSDPLKDTIQLYTSAEINIWRQEVLRRQKDEYGYNFCELCDSRIDLQAHHEKSQKTHPGMTLDPDNGIILCKDCHYKYGHKTGTECSTGNLANYNPCK